jgi:hypothetical protein
MTTVATRVRRIADLEEFDLVVTRDGQPVDVKQNGVMDDYPYDRKMKHTKTVNDFKRERFAVQYPGLSCDVLLGDGNVAAPQTSLGTVRESYEEDAE